MQQVVELIISFTSIIGAPVGIASAGLTLIFSLTIGKVKKLLNITINTKEKHKILMLAKSKLNSWNNISSINWHGYNKPWRICYNFGWKKNKYEKMKNNLRGENGKYKIMRLSSIKSKI